MKANQKTLHRQIRSQFQGKRKIPFLATDQEISHGRDITWTVRAKEAPQHIREDWSGTSWIVEVATKGTRDGKPFHATHLFLTSLRTTPEALLQLVRDRWSIKGWQWIRDTQLNEDAHRYRGNSAGAVAIPAAPGWLPFDPNWPTGGDARHHGAAGNGVAAAGTRAEIEL